jgi:hypothetical protein
MNKKDKINLFCTQSTGLINKASAALDFPRLFRAIGLHDLVKNAAIIEVRFLNFSPATKFLINRH